MVQSVQSVTTVQTRNRFTTEVACYIDPSPKLQKFFSKWSVIILLMDMVERKRNCRPSNWQGQQNFCT